MENVHCNQLNPKIWDELHQLDEVIARELIPITIGDEFIPEFCDDEILSENAQVAIVKMNEFWEHFIKNTCNFNWLLESKQEKTMFTSALEEGKAYVESWNLTNDDGEISKMQKWNNIETDDWYVIIESKCFFWIVGIVSCHPFLCTPSLFFANSDGSTEIPMKEELDINQFLTWVQAISMDFLSSQEH